MKRRQGTEHLCWQVWMDSIESKLQRLHCHSWPACLQELVRLLLRHHHLPIGLSALGGNVGEQKVRANASTGCKQQHTKYKGQRRWHGMLCCRCGTGPS